MYVMSPYAACNYHVQWGPNSWLVLVWWNRYFVLCIANQLDSISHHHLTLTLLTMSCSLSLLCNAHFPYCLTFTLFNLLCHTHCPYCLTLTLLNLLCHTHCPYCLMLTVLNVSRSLFLMSHTHCPYCLMLTLLNVSCLLSHAHCP